MSRTDKDRPWWVMTLQDDNYISHDHRFGKCIEETPEYAVAVNGRHWYAPHHWRRCKKRIEVTEYCTKKEPHRDWYGRPTCWTHRCACGARPAHNLGFFCDVWVRVQCNGHTIRTTDDSIPCVCDEWPDPPTCDIELADPTRHRYCAGGVPTAFVRSVYHRPERARERRLRDLAREYNAYGELEDGDFFNRQARNSARWDWW